MTDVPVAGIQVEVHCSSNDFDGNQKALFVNLRGEPVEIEKMFVAEDNHTAIGSHRIEIRKTHCLPDADPSFWNDLFQELGRFQ